MKKIDINNAVGCTLCHDITAMKDGFKGALFKRGHIIEEKDIPVMLDLGKKQFLSGMMVVILFTKKMRQKQLQI